jgi:hypothetical protein
VEVWGPGFIFCFSVVVFLVAQLVFIKEASLYVSLTFGSLLFMIAAVYLPQLLKLKLPGFELEKASLDRVSGLAIGISRSESLISTRCRSLTD